jgi:hypothetical protein
VIRFQSVSSMVMAPTNTGGVGSTVVVVVVVVGTVVLVL